MLKRFVFLTGFVLLFGITAQSYAAVDGEIPQLGVAPVIDGQMDTLWSSLQEHKFTHYVSGATTDADCSASWRAYWDTDNLYIFVDVNDDALNSNPTSTSQYQFDSVEIFADIHNNNATTWVTGSDDYQYRFSYDATTPVLSIDHAWDSTVGIEYKFLVTGTGYNLEVKIPWSTLYLTSERPTVGDLMGFEVQINDDDNGSTRETQLSWYATANNVYNNPSNMGTVSMIGTLGQAKNPNPSNKASEIARNVILSWTSALNVTSHNLFIGTDADSVANATVANAAQMGVSLYQVDSNSVSLKDLEFSGTYYWRVDEVGADKGAVWSFKTELKGYPLATSHVKATANNGIYSDTDTQDPNSTCNGSGLDANDMHLVEQKTMWLATGEPGECWIQYAFDMVYKLNDIKIWNYNEVAPTNAFGAKDVNIIYSLDGQTWTQVGDTVTLDMAPGDNTCAASAPIDLQGVIAKYVKIIFWSGYDPETPAYGISEVRFSAIPTYVQSPVPANNATNQAADAVLSWKAGRDVNDHYLYISTDPNNLGSANIVQEATFSPDLALGKTYYWRVDEVNNAEAYPVWEGPVWKLSVVASRLIEGFETGYGDSDTNAVWVTWLDGDGGKRPANGGSQMGNYNAPYLSTVNHSGGHSSPVIYDNTGTFTFSQVVAQSVNLPIGTSDWSLGSPTALVIWLRGDPNNIPDQMYVKLNNSKVLYDGDPAYLTQSVWRPWVIDLSQANVDITNVTSMTIGFEKTATQSGKGTVLVDDISLYGVGPAIAEAVNPGTNGLVASYSMENNVQDSSGNGHNGTIVGTPTYVQGMTGRGMAMQFNGSTDAVDIGQSDAFNFEGSFTISVWAKISAWTTGYGYTMVSNRGETDKGGWQIRRAGGFAGGNRFLFTTRGISNDDMTSNANPPPLNEWVNFTCVYDSVARTKNIYIDGVLDRSVNLTGTVTKVTATTGIDAYIGGRAKTDNSGPENCFNGLLDDVRIYNRALSAGEVVYLADPTP